MKNHLKRFDNCSDFLCGQGTLKLEARGYSSFAASAQGILNNMWRPWYLVRHVVRKMCVEFVIKISYDCLKFFLLLFVQIERFRSVVLSASSESHWFFCPLNNLFWNLFACPIFWLICLIRCIESNTFNFTFLSHASSNDFLSLFWLLSITVIHGRTKCNLLPVVKSHFESESDWSQLDDNQNINPIWLFHWTEFYKSCDLLTLCVTLDLAELGLHSRKCEIYLSNRLSFTDNVASFSKLYHVSFWNRSVCLVQQLIIGIHKVSFLNKAHFKEDGYFLHITQEFF